MEQTFYIAGGTLDPDAPSYIERRADRQLLAGLLGGEFCYVLDTRQVGKSSLTGRAMARLQEQGVRVAALDLSRIGQSLKVDQWYYGLLVDLGGPLGLREPLRAFWQQNKDLGPMQRWLEALRQVVLPSLTPESGPDSDSLLPSPAPKSKPHLVIFVDEIDNVLNLPFSTDEFFAGIRECYTRRIHDPIMRGLTFCLVGSTTPDNLIRDARTTPFNIGRSIELTDFTPAEAAPLAKGLSSGGRDGHKLLSRVLYWTNGHPYLTQRLCQAVAEEEKVRTRSGVDSLCEELFFAHGRREKEANLSFVASRILKSDLDQASLLDAYALIRRRHLVRDDPANRLCAVLRLSGIVRVVAGYLWVRNRIYHHVFDRAWVQANMPDGELRRQQAAYRKGLIRALAFSGLGVTLVGSLAITAFNAERRAQRSARTLQLQRDDAQHHLYIADINLSQQTLEQQHNVMLAMDLLKAHRNDRWRGFEWRYLWRECDQSLFTCPTGATATYAVAYSPDGKLLATADKSGTVRLWDAFSGRFLRSFRPHTRAAIALAFSPDGKRLATSGEDQTICISEVATGKRLLVLRTQPILLARYRMKSIAFGPGGKWLAAGGDNRVTIWDTTNAKQLRVLRSHADSVNEIGISSDGTMIASASSDGNARIWDPATGKLIRILTGNSSGMTSLAFSRDANWLVTGDDTGVLRLWNPATGQNIFTINISNEQLCSLAFSPDGRRLAIGTTDSSVRILDMFSGRRLETLLGHAGFIQSISFSPDGKRLASASFDGTVKVWDVTPDKDTVRLEGYQKPYMVNLCFSPDGTRLAAMSPDLTAVTVWDSVTGTRITSFPSAWHPVDGLAFTPNGKELAIGGADNRLGLYDVATGRLNRVIHTPLPGFSYMIYTPNGRSLAVLSADERLYLWDLDTGKARSWKQYLGGVAAFTPDGLHLAVGSLNAPLEIGNIAGEWNPKTLPPLSSYPSTIAFLPDGKAAFTGGHEGMARLWDVETGRELLTIKASQDPILAAHLYADGVTLKTVDQEGVIHTWQAATDAEIETAEHVKTSGGSPAY